MAAAVRRAEPRSGAGGGGGSNLVPVGGSAGISPGPSQVAITYTPLTLTTTASPDIALGGQVFDTATLSGGAAPTGEISFRLFGPDDPACARTPAFVDTVAVSGSGDYRSGAFSPTLAGTYRWVASYSGDAANPSAASACNGPGARVTVSGAPRIGKTANVHLASGVVLINTGDGEGFTPLTEDRQIPIGSRLNACEGRVDVTTAKKSGGTQTARFWAGRFQVRQRTSRTLTVMKLIGPEDNCSEPRSGRAGPTPMRRGSSRKLWGKGNGKFQSNGHHGSASTRGTTWLIEDLPGRVTRVRVRKGVVLFRDFINRTKTLVRAGESAVAEPRSFGAAR